MPNPLYSGPRPSGGQTARRADIDTTSFDVHASSAQAAMTASTFSSFQSQINGVHGSVHIAVGGDMSSVPSAGFDPIFYLHHANIDRLWANWQASHPGALPASEASFALLPFDRPYSASYYTGADMESTSALGYRYRNFCFYLPPFRLWEVVKVRWPLPLARRVPSVRLVLKSHHMQPAPVEFRVFVNQPGADSKTPLSPDAGFAGLAASFGHGPADPHGQPPRADKAAPTDEHALHRPAPQPGVKERFDLEIDITKALAEAAARSEELLLKVLAVDGQGAAVPNEKVLLEEAVIELA